MSEVETIVLKKPKKDQEQRSTKLDATARLVESNRLKREAKAKAKEGAKAPEKVPEPKKEESKPIEEVIVKKPRKPRVRKSTPDPSPS